jgi:hypothetical protein
MIEDRPIEYPNECRLLADFVAEGRCRLFWSVIPSLWSDSRRERTMMGRLNHDQAQFFYSFRLDEAVPRDHPVREVAGVLDLGWVHSELAPYYPQLGRPSIDPVLMIRMLIVGYPWRLTPTLGVSSDAGATPNLGRYIWRYLHGDFGQHGFQLPRIDLVGRHQATDKRIR